MNTPIKKLITHNGSFHTDDIFSAAALSLLLEKRGEEFEIIRSRDMDVIKTGDIVFDVGGMYDPDADRFDHHQPGGAGKRDYGFDYSSFGVVWKKYGEELTGDARVAKEIDKKLVTPIDAWDVGFNITENKYDIAPYFLQHIFFAMHPTWKEVDANKDEIFMKCVEIAKMVLSREITHITDALSAEDTVEKIYQATEDKRIVVFEDNYPFEMVLMKHPEPIYGIYPRKTDNTWGVKAINKKLGVFENRKDLPLAWKGLRDEELAKTTGVEDAVFCHPALYLCAAKTKEGAIKLAQIALESK